jgi:hypothetical protein
MMFDQFSAIFDNTPGIDAMQNRHGVKVYHSNTSACVNASVAML